MTTARLLLAASVLGATAVAAGAFGAHALQGRVEPTLQDVWQTAAHYHLVHAVALLAIAIPLQHRQEASPNRWLMRAAACWVLGILVFSGSLYALVLTGVRGLGAVTPIGGVLLIVGWLMLAMLALWPQAGQGMSR